MSDDRRRAALVEAFRRAQVGLHHPPYETQAERMAGVALRALAPGGEGEGESGVERLTVKGRCPNCGRLTLFLGMGGHVACSADDCDDPAMVDDLLAFAQRYGERVREVRLTAGPASKSASKDLAESMREDDMDDLRSWLAAVLDETERVAREATAGPWQWENELCWSPAGEECADHSHSWGHSGPDLYGADREIVVSSYGHDADGVIVSREDATHIARHNPQAVIARVEAERMIVWEHREEREPWTAAGPIGHPICSHCAGQWPCVTVRALAYGHRFDAPGWREEWAPAD